MANIIEIVGKSYLVPIDESPAIVIDIDEPAAIVIFGTASVVPLVLLLSSGSSPQYIPPSSRGTSFFGKSAGNIPNIQ